VSETKKTTQVRSESVRQALDYILGPHGTKELTTLTENNLTTSAKKPSHNGEILENSSGPFWKSVPAINAFIFLGLVCLAVGAVLFYRVVF
jgi:hypothetical protein